jgi:nucleotide-binding universal stress UspA family protein
MKKIIIPTDFSDTAANAYAYARELCEITNSDLKTVHVFHPSADDNLMLPTTLTELRMTQEKKLDQFTNRSEKGKESVTTLVEKEVRMGFAADEIISLSKEEDTDFILMGTTGSGGILENLVGSVSSTVAQNAQCPVWLIPPNTTFTGIKNILFAGDYETATDEMIDEIMGLAYTFGADVHLVHVNETGNHKRDSRLEETVMDRLFEKRIPEFMMKFVTIEGDTTWKALQRYASDYDIDLVVTVTMRRSFWDQLFHKSTTKAMVLHATKPLLVLHVDDK